jgi:hypothetical protein
MWEEELAKVKVGNEREFVGGRVIGVVVWSTEGKAIVSNLE